jgi:hypothetical protein
MNFMSEIVRRHLQTDANDFRKLNTSSFTDELEAAAYKSKTDEILEN